MFAIVATFVVDSVLSIGQDTAFRRCPLLKSCNLASKKQAATRLV